MPQYLSPGVYVEEVPPSSRPIAGVATSIAGFIGIVPQSIQLPAERVETTTNGTTTITFKVEEKTLPDAGIAKLVTNWSQFVSTFADLAGDKTLGNLTDVDEPSFDTASLNSWSLFAQAVYGFFNNGGTRCYVIRIDSNTELAAALNTFASIDEITMVAIPGIISQAEQEAVIGHCENLKDRFAILDGQQNPDPIDRDSIKGNTRDSNYAALYFPWIKVFDPAKQILDPSSNGSIILPPSGHLAGVYSRVDGERGVFKAPANEVIRGALDLEYNLTKADQDGLNPLGINIIRSFKGNIKVWGARTLGGEDNGEYKYISTRRYFNYLRESIDEGTQFAVFEPNNLALWQRIKRTVGDFLLNEWRNGALFGETPEKAFFVKCDAETNPKEVRELGQVVTLIGVAIVKPAEFVIFRIQQTAGE
ncbi:MULTISPECIES: phage tail sheath subtilisin-like domain-containing protein [Okeania]|uniref:Phage tail sheath family protein n=1 Tax=Okeania hirsuta TaxID=1458930 RepID=A0A3N6PJH6_9CYAN|nr:MULTISPECIES: phage tail sheath subtilisin-like domain-containing protein [Okeania]NES89100.1 phage tail sheath family protein [Okeania sp. SIO2B9]RQH53456.1 phage tail sheath family protein [Okeania hirsuta]